MSVSESATNAVIGFETEFVFTQQGELVTGNYFGGAVRRGFLVGLLTGDTLDFAYCQLRQTGLFDHGVSRCSLSVEGGRYVLRERFIMETPTGQETGENVLREI